MARKSSGEVEEGYADFNGESSRAITFELKATGEPNFSSPPQVKLASVERVDHLYKYFFFNRSGIWKGEYTSGTVVKYGSEVGYTAPTANPHQVGTTTPLAAIPYQPEYFNIAGGSAKAGFSFAEERKGAPVAANTVRLYFQIWFSANWSEGSGEGLDVYFGKESVVGYGTGNSANESLTSVAYLDNRRGSWDAAVGSATGRSISLDHPQ